MVVISNYMTIGVMHKLIKNKTKMMNKEKKIIKVPIPKEIWDADASLCNLIMGRDIMGTWMKSVVDVVKQCDKPNQR
jgi:hypothetical protein